LTFVDKPKGHVHVLKNVLKRASATATAVGAAAALVITATPAHAVNPAQTEVIAAAGSDTTEEFMSAYLNTAPAANDFNIATRAATNVPADAGAGANCPAAAYAAGQINGSNAGVNALNASVTAGDSCIDIARSSRGPTPAEITADLHEFYAFAMDAVGIATASLNAPPQITLAQLQAIYRCQGPRTLNGVPGYYYWSDLGVAPGNDPGVDTAGPNPGALGTANAVQTIRPFLPQAGSGTRSFFLAQVLVMTEAQVPACVSGLGFPQEHTGRDPVLGGPLSGAPAANANRYQNSLVPYSVGQWVSQANQAADTSRDLRNGFRFVSINDGCAAGAQYPAVYGFGGAARWFPNAAPFSTAPIITVANANAGTPGCGVRFVHNVTHKNSLQFAQAEAHVGFGSVLCSGGATGTINSSGFAPIPDQDPTAVVRTCINRMPPPGP
jgi:ABC-type phosphate transport system substrate-binding protein